MTPEEQKRFYEMLESVAIAQAMQLLIQQTEQNPSDDPGHQAMLVFFRSIYAKYRRKASAVRIKKDDFGQVQVIDDTLRQYGTN